MIFLVFHSFIAFDESIHFGDVGLFVSFGCFMVKEFVEIRRELQLHFINVLNMQTERVSCICRSLNGEVATELMSVVVPVVKVVIVFDFELATYDIDKSKVVSIANRNVLLIVKNGKYKMSSSFIHEKDIGDVITFFENELVNCK